MNRSLQFAIGLTLIAGCIAEAQDTIRVRNTGTPIWGAKVAITPLVSMGEIDGPPEYALGAIDGVVADAKGRFYTYDTKDTQIRQYDADGKFVRLIGRSGAGPGEYRGVYGMGIHQDSILAVFDLSNARVSLFQPDGKLLRSISQPRMTWGFEHGVAADKVGLLVFRRPGLINGRSDMEMSAEGPSPGMKVSDGYALRMRTDGSLADSIPIPPPGRMQRGFYLTGADGGNRSFVAQQHVAVSPLGAVVFGMSDRYRFVIRQADGKVRVVEQPWTPVPVGSDERANWLEYVAYFEKRDGGRVKYEIPGTKPAYRDLAVDNDGRIWVSLYTATEKRDIPPRPDRPRLQWRQNATYDVFDPAGAYLGRVALPPNSRMVFARGDRMWVLAKGADDEDKVIVYRLAIPGRKEG